MMPHEAKARFDFVSSQLWQLSAELEKLASTLSHPADQLALRALITNLTEAQRTCTMIGLHQLGPPLDKNLASENSQGLAHPMNH